MLRLITAVFVLLLSVRWVSPARTAGDVYLDEKEAQVTRLQQQVQSNHLRQCELLASCDTPANCSRRSCWPLVGDVERTTCQQVKANAYCDASACISKKFDFTRPYIRLASTTDQSATQTATTICAQRELSMLFKDICNATSLSQTFSGSAFFGSVDGTYSQFPGSDQSDADCELYDPRGRPWYTNSASVTKVVMVLLDVGESMGNSVSPPLLGTFFATAQAIVQELLITLSAQDYINIVTFDSTKATRLAPSPVRVQLNEAQNSDFGQLKASLANLTNLDLDNRQQPSNISLGVAEALAQYATPYPSALQIIVAFTDGDAQNLNDGALAALRGRNGTKVFIFKLPQADDVPNRFLAGTPFLAQLRAMGGSFTVITTEASNPLYSILPYFSFLAGIRAKINASADYSNIYEDFENVTDKAFSITKPAFDEDGNLLGVGGLKIFVDELGNLTEDVTLALQSRIKSTKFDPATVALTAADARIQNVSSAPPCPSISKPNGMGLCSRTDTQSTIKDRSCCDACTTSPPAHANSTPKYIAIGLCLGVFGIVAAVCSVLFCCGVFPCCERPKRPILDKFPGLSDHE